MPLKVDDTRPRQHPLVKSKHKLIKDLVMVKYMTAIANIRSEILMEIIVHKV